MGLKEHAEKDNELRGDKRHGEKTTGAKRRKPRRGDEIRREKNDDNKA